MSICVRRNRGFSLVELVVVLAIIGVLIALLLPAVQAARESARRSHCKNNLKQLGLALHLYHDNHRAFPPGSLNEWSWIARVLPFVEQEGTLDQFDLSVEPFEPPNWDKLDVVLGVLGCPDDQKSKSVFTSAFGFRFAHTNYHGSLDADNSTDRGMFAYSRSNGFQNVLDGTSQTIFVGERPVIFDGEQTYGWWVWGSDTTIRASAGFRQGDLQDPNSRKHWWSFHPEGASFVFVDGSVHFLRYTIDPRVFNALGTKDGGETPQWPR